MREGGVDCPAVAARRRMCGRRYSTDSTAVMHKTSRVDHVIRVCDVHAVSDASSRQ